MYAHLVIKDVNKLVLLLVESKKTIRLRILFPECSHDMIIVNYNRKLEKPEI